MTGLKGDGKHCEVLAGLLKREVASNGRKSVRIGKKLLPSPTPMHRRHPIDRLSGAIRQPSGEELKLHS